MSLRWLVRPWLRRGGGRCARIRLAALAYRAPPRPGPGDLLPEAARARRDGGSVTRVRGRPRLLSIAGKPLHDRGLVPLAGPPHRQPDPAARLPGGQARAGCGDRRTAAAGMVAATSTAAPSTPATSAPRPLSLSAVCRLSQGYAFITVTNPGAQTVRMSYVTVTIYARGAQVGTIPHGYADQVAPGTSVDVSPRSTPRASSRRPGAVVDERAPPAPRPVGQLPTPTFGDLADLAVRRLHERMRTGELAVSARDAVAIARLALEIEHDEGLAAGRAAREMRAAFEAGLWALRAAVIRRFGEDAWPAVLADVRGELRGWGQGEVPGPPGTSGAGRAVTCRGCGPRTYGRPAVSRAAAPRECPRTAGSTPSR